MTPFSKKKFFMIKYTLHPSPRDNRDDAQVHYHPRIDAHNDVAHLKQLEHVMTSHNSPLARYSHPALIDISDAMIELFSYGKSVCLPEIGTFTPQLSGDITLDSSGKPRAKNVRISSITFRPDRDFLKAASQLDTTLSDRIHLDIPDPEVLERNLAEHFAHHATLSRHQLIYDIYAGIITTYRANKILASLVAAGRLVPVGPLHSSKRCYRLP